MARFQSEISRGTRSRQRRRQWPGRDVESIRSVLQSLVLAVGAYLVINQESTGGIIIAASILTARALAPVELVIANWKGFVGARQSGQRLDQLLKLLPKEEQPLELPPPRQTRPDIVHSSIYVPKAAYRKLREIALARECKVHDLVLDGDRLRAARAWAPNNGRA